MTPRAKTFLFYAGCVLIGVLAWVVDWVGKGGALE